MSKAPEEKDVDKLETRIWHNYEMKKLKSDLDIVLYLEGFRYSEEDTQRILQDQSDTLVIIVTLQEYKYTKPLQITEARLLYSQILEQMGISKWYLQSYSKRLQGFFGDPIKARGQITLIAEVGEALCQRRTIVDFVVFNLPFSYNAILGRPILQN